MTDYQTIGSERLRENSHFLLADEMGTGKTKQLLDALPDRGMVYAPASLRGNWVDECKKWRKDLKPIVILGSGNSDQVNFRWPRAGELTISGYTSLPKWLAAPPGTSGYKPGDKTRRAQATRTKLKTLRKVHKAKITHEYQWGKNTPLIYDEAHALSNEESQRADRAYWLSAMCKSVWLATGTPMPRGDAIALYDMLKAGQMHDRVFGHYGRFKRLADVRHIHGADRAGVLSKRIREVLAPHMLRRTKAQVSPELPPILRQTISVDLGPVINSQLDKFSEFVSYRSLLALQGLPAWKDFARTRRVVAEALIPEMLNQVARFEAQGARLLVFSCHSRPIAQFKNRPGWAIVGPHSKRSVSDVVRDQEQFRGIAISSASGRDGLNLQSFSRGLWVDREWNVNADDQALARMHRKGQQAEAINAYYLAPNHAIYDHLVAKHLRARENLEVLGL